MGGEPPPLFPGHHVLTPSRSSQLSQWSGLRTEPCKVQWGGTCPAPCGPHFGCEHFGFQAETRLAGHTWPPALEQLRCAFKNRWLLSHSALPIFILIRAFRPPNKTAALMPGGALS